MPLVQYQFRETRTLNHFGSFPKGIPIQMKIKLPPKATAANWRLKEVNASYFRAEALKIRYCEIVIPELMQGNHVFYSLNSQSGTVEPSRMLRFYFNRYSNDQDATVAGNDEGGPSEASNLKTVVSHPDLDLGYHILDKRELTLNFSMPNTDAAATLVAPYAFSVILEYNE